MTELKIGEVELLAAIDLLKKISPEEREAVILALEHDHPGIGDRARAALELEERKVVKLHVVEPVKSVEKPEVRDKYGNLYRWVNGGYRRALGVVQLKVVEQPRECPCFIEGGLSKSRGSAFSENASGNGLSAIRNAEVGCHGASNRG